MADTLISTRSLSQVPFVFIPYIKRGSFIFQLRHTNAEMKQFFPDGELLLKPEDGWNTSFTAVLYILHMLRQEHQTIRRNAKTPIQRNLSKTPLLQMQYILYDYRHRCHGEKEDSEWYFSDRISMETTRWSLKTQTTCFLLVPSSWRTRLNTRQSHFTTKLASVHACLDFKLAKQRILISWETSVSFC